MSKEEILKKHRFSPNALVWDDLGERHSLIDVLGLFDQQTSAVRQELEEQSELIKHLQEQAFNNSVELDRYRLVTVPELEKELEKRKKGIERFHDKNMSLRSKNKSLSARVSELEAECTQLALDADEWKGLYFAQKGKADTLSEREHELEEAMRAAKNYIQEKIKTKNAIYPIGILNRSLLSKHNKSLTSPQGDQNKQQ